MLWNHAELGVEVSGGWTFRHYLQVLNLRGNGVNIQKYWMIWHVITLLLYLLPYYIYLFIYLNFLLYFENKEIFCFCVWLQIFSTFCNLNYCSFVRFCDIILSLVLDEFKQILAQLSISIAWSAWIHLMLGVKVGRNLTITITISYLL